MITELPTKIHYRYPTVAERDTIAEYARTVPMRVHVLEQMRGKIPSIVAGAIDEMQALYAQFSRTHPAAWKKAARDLEICMTFAANAMVLGGVETLDRVFLIWFRSILKAVHFTPQLMRDAMRLLDAEMKRQLTAEAYGLMKPSFDHTAQRLCDIPEPLRPEVGERTR